MSKLNSEIVQDTIARHDGDFFSAAKELGKAPYRVLQCWRRFANKSKAIEVARLDGKVQMWDELRSRLQQTERLRKENKMLRKCNLAMSNYTELHSAFEKALKLKGNKPLVEKQRYVNHHDTTHEWLFSDLHYGKKCDGYSTAIADGRVSRYARYIQALQAKEKPKITRIAFLGDLFENSSKHRDSMAGCEMGTAEQIVGAYHLISSWLDKILPKAGEVEVVGVAGNHENLLGKGSQLNYMGNAHGSHVIYSLLQDKFKSRRKMKWFVPEGNFAVMGHAVYEHGDLAVPTEKAMASVLAKRSRQVDVVCKRYRQGDKHVAVIGDAGNLICNGAFFSDRAGTEFSGVHGYASQPCQVGVSECGDAYMVHMVRFD